jgi:hypothetical protein
LINYEFQQNGEALEISGQSSLGEHYQMLYSRLRRFNVYLFFLDEGSVVLKTVELLNVATDRTNDTFEFRRSLRVPSGATGLAFGYRGRVEENQERDHFYQLPL